MSSQFQFSVNQILKAFQRVGLNKGEAYKPDQIYNALDELIDKVYDRDVATQIYEKCTRNQIGQVLIEEFSKKLISADAKLKKKIHDTKQQIQSLIKESKNCQIQIQELQNYQQYNQYGLDIDSSLNLMIKSVSGITNEDYTQSYLSITVDNNEQIAKQSGGDKYNPLFNEQLGFQIKTGRENIIFSLLVEDLNQMKSLIGQAKIYLSQLYDQQVHSLSLQLQNDSQQIDTATILFDAQWIFNKLKSLEEMIPKNQSTIQQLHNDIEDYKRDLYIVQYPFMNQYQRQKFQYLLKPLTTSNLKTNSALIYQQQQQNQTQIIDKPTPSEKSLNQDNIQTQFQGEEIDELSDEIYYGFILYVLMIILSIFQCFARPAYVDILLGILYLLIIFRDCFNPEYLKIVGTITVLSIVLDIVWISIYKNWWSCADKTLPIWAEAENLIFKLVILFCIFNMVLKTYLCFIIFCYYKEAQSNQVLSFKAWSLEFQFGIHKQNLFTLDNRLLF